MDFYGISVSPIIPRFKTGAPGKDWRFPDTVLDKLSP